MADPRVAVVTGAGAGIGRAISVALGALGWNVAVGARRTERLEETAKLVEDAGGRALAHVLDVCEPASIDSFMAVVERAYGTVDVLVNNAGVAWVGAAHEMDDDDHRRIIETNLVAPILLTKRIVARLRAVQCPGDIVFVSSDAAHHVRPHMATYGASKAGLEVFASALALECEGSPIRAAVIRVGPTLTGFADDWDPEQLAPLMPYWQRFGIQRHFNTMVPEDVARAVVTAVTAPPHMRIPVVEVQPQAPHD